jgi:betaine-aldehyde dehydrogenase
MSVTSVGNVIGGHTHKARSGRTVRSLDPTTGEVWAEAPDSDAADVADAVESAASAWSAWRRTLPRERMDAMLAAAAALADHAEELATAEVADTGKTRQAFLEDELPPSLDLVRFLAGAARLLEGRSAGEYEEGITSAVRREPIGVCAGITPWNYPLMMAVWKWAPAVAAGNTVVLKPSELTPVSTVLMAEVLAGVLPPGVVNVVCGGPAAGEALASHPTVAQVSLTGSVRAGRAVATAAAQRLARTHLELGGNAPAVVLADADLEAAAEGIAAGAYLNAGQDCTAASRVLVARPAAARLVELLCEQAAQTDVGPLVSEQALERVLGLLDRLPARAAVVAGGKRLTRPGWHLPATVVAGVEHDDEIVQAEIFGPVVTVQGFDDVDEALELANGVPYGLTASVWTRDQAASQRFLRDLDFGAVSVNVHAPMANEMPHGGFGVSGYGKDLAVYGLEDYTRLKHVAQAW